jgi:hypothetical protein
MERVPGILLSLVQYQDEPQRYLVTLTGGKKASQ